MFNGTSRRGGGAEGVQQGGQRRKRTRERERGRDEKVSRSSSQEQEQSSGPKHLSPSASVPLLWPPTPSGPPRDPPTCMYSLADARTCQCDQFTLETLTKIKFQVHRPRRSLFHSEGYSEFTIARNVPAGENATDRMDTTISKRS